MRFVTLILFMFFALNYLTAKELPTRVERDAMLIGEVNTIIVKHNGALRKVDLIDFTILKAKKSQSTEKSESIDLEVYNIVFSPSELRIDFLVWDTAWLVLPPFALNKTGTISTEALMFRVDFPDVNALGDIADVYEMEIEPSKFYEFWLKYWWLLDVLIFILFLIGLWSVLKKHEIQEIVEPTIHVPADERALSDLESLMRKKLFSNDDQKLHFAEFSDILRRYIGTQYQFITFEKTTNEILNHLHKNRLGRSVIARLAELLNLADMIKFSKATTDETEMQRSYEEAKALIQLTSQIQLDLENEEKGASDA